MFINQSIIELYGFWVILNGSVGFEGMGYFGGMCWRVWWGPPNEYPTSLLGEWTPCYHY